MGALFGYVAEELKHFLSDGEIGSFANHWLADRGIVTTGPIPEDLKSQLFRAMSDHIVDQANRKREDDLREFAKQWLSKRGYGLKDTIDVAVTRELKEAATEFWNGASRRA